MAPPPNKKPSKKESLPTAEPVNEGSKRREQKALLKKLSKSAVTIGKASPAGGK